MGLEFAMYLSLIPGDISKMKKKSRSPMNSYLSRIELRDKAEHLNSVRRDFWC